eukprot:scaffold1146_cov399-Prasinococcus_capsulatus_cf.AAC.78
MENLLRRFQELYSRVGDQAAAWDAEVQHGAKLIGAIASAIDNLQVADATPTISRYPRAAADVEAAAVSAAAPV